MTFLGDPGPTHQTSAPRRFRLLCAAGLLASLHALTAFGQLPNRFADPANLRSERVTPRTGRELPIDGGASADGTPNTALGLQQLLRKLNTRASLMLIVAHPDDEDGGMLTLLSRGLGARVADLSLTRGEGGQNAMTGDFEDALGLIRTEELLAADRYSGTDQFFGTEVDFGFSKTKEESFRKWTHQRVLYDAVRAVRLYRPLVIAAVFIGGVTDGHGQHQVSGEIAQEVFKAAADPTVFPELTREGILPWAPLKVFARVPSFAIQPQGLFDYATNQYVPPSFTNYVNGETTATPPTPDVILHEGNTDPLLTTCAANPADLAPSTALSLHPTPSPARPFPLSFRSAAKESASPPTTPCTPLSYVQFARIGLGLQRTQIGPGVRLASPGAYDVAYHLYGSRLCINTSPQNAVILSAAKDPCLSPAAPKHPAAGRDPETASFFDGIDTSIASLASLAPSASPLLTRGLHRLQTQLDGLSEAFDPHRPAALAPPLVQAQHDLGALLDDLEHQHFAGREDVLHELRIKQVQLNTALTLALGLDLSGTPDTPEFNVTLGSTITIKTVLRAGEAGPVGVFSEHLEDGSGHSHERLLAVDAEPLVAAGRPLAITLQTSPQQTLLPTRPFFFRTDLEQPVYQLRNPALRNAAATPTALTVWATLRYRETEVQLGQVVDAGDQPLQIVPPVSLTLPSHAQVFPDAQRSVRVNLQVSPADTRVEADLPPRWTVTQDPASDTTAPGRKLLQLEPPAPLERPLQVRASAVVSPGKQFHEGYTSVGYGHLPATNFYADAALRLRPVHLALPTHRRVAYLPGTGDAVPDNLRSVGFPVTPLTVADLTPDHLKSFDTVILGVRTYNAHPDLHGAPTHALLDFARNGGNVIVQYQAGEFTSADAPFPLSLGAAEKVVDETTPVRLLDPAAPAFTTPNPITAADFSGWVEERGHGFMATWDPHYAALTETHDPGAPAEHIAPQLPQKGGLLTTPLGKGHWTYVSFALYRQLPEAVPGAFRLFTNLLALADQP